MDGFVCLVECPHCGCFIQIREINCAIFRHGVYKQTGQQIDPHLPKADCDRLVATGALYGCGRPFRLKRKGGGVTASPEEWIAEICEYI